jgi:hypothetical protein
MVGGAQERQEAAIPEATVGTAATSAGDDLPPRRPLRRAAAPVQCRTLNTEPYMPRPKP